MAKQTAKAKKAYTVESLVRSNDFIRYADILVAIFGFDTKVTKEEATKAIQNHLKREVK